MTSRNFSLTVTFDWDFDDTFTDESSRVISVNVERSLIGVGNPITGGSGRVQKATIVLNNYDNRYSSKITSGALYSDVANGGIYFVPVRINLNTTNDYRIFTGKCTIPKEKGESFGSDKNITIIAFSNEEVLRNSFGHITTDQAYAWIDNLPTEDEVISYLLNTLSLSGTLDPGLYPVFSYLSGGSILTEIWEIARASGGYFFCNRSGNFIYKNASSFFGSSSLTTLDRSEFGQIEMMYDERNISRSVEVKGSIPTKSVDSIVYTHGEAIIISPSEVVKLRLEYSNLIYNVAGITYNCTTYGGTDLSGSLTFSGTYYIDSAIVNFTNGASVDMVISNLSITGKEINSLPFEINKQSVDSFWTDRTETNVETKLRNNYIASYIAADSFASLILERQQNPLPTYIIQDIIYDGAIELLDKFTIDDDTINSSTFDIIVMGINYRVSKQSGARVSIVGVDNNSIYPYQSTSPSYFVLGTNKLGSTDALKARLFY